MAYVANQPYDLTTEHGRAQSRALSAYGAMLAEQVEIVQEQTAEEFSEEVEKLLRSPVPVALETIATAPFLCKMGKFKKDLGVRDAEAFEELVDAFDKLQSEIKEAIGHVRQQEKELQIFRKNLRGLFDLEDEE